jgi:hypothetical protein
MDRVRELKLALLELRVEPPHDPTAAVSPDSPTAPQSNHTRLDARRPSSERGRLTRASEFSSIGQFVLAMAVIAVVPIVSTIHGACRKHRSSTLLAVAPAVHLASDPTAARRLPPQASPLPSQGTNTTDSTPGHTSSRLASPLSTPPVVARKAHSVGGQRRAGPRQGESQRHATIPIHSLQSSPVTRAEEKSPPAIAQQPTVVITRYLSNPTMATVPASATNSRAVSHMESLHTEAVRLQAGARHSGDIVKLNCVNESLLRIKILLNNADARGATSGLVKQADAALVAARSC